MVEVIRIVAAAAAVVLACLGAGRTLWGRRPQSLALTFVSGAAGLSVALFALLALRLYSSPAICVVLLLAAAGVWGIERPVLRRPPWWAVAAGLVFAGLYAVHTLAPEIQPDGAGYHLGIPSQWLRQGGFGKRLGFYELLPLGVETLYGAAMALGGAPAAKLVHLMFLGSTIPLTLQVARRLGLAESAGWGGAMLFALSPVTGISGSSSYTDAALVAAHLALFLLLLEWKDEPSARIAAQAGLIAGLCYSIKVTGAVAALGVLAYMLWRKRPASMAAFCGGTAAVALPWAAKAWRMTGNPLAPLGNGWFDNDAFNAATEQALGHYLRQYDIHSWAEIPGSLLADGTAMQGLIGPVFILMPLAFLALRKPAGRWLMAAACISALPWFLNIGARFLMPPLAFAALALACVLPGRVIPALVLLHGALSLPIVMDRYTGRGAWRLRGWPWQAALRVVPEEKYLKEKFWDYGMARVVATRVKPGETVLDLLGVPLLYSQTPATGPLPSVPFDQMSGTLGAAAMAFPQRLVETKFSSPVGFARGVRLRAGKGLNREWAVAEMRFEREGERLSVPRAWFLSAWPLPQDASLAVDANRASRWRTYGQAKPGSYVEILFDRPIPFDLLAVLANARAEADLGMEVYVLTMERKWMRMLPAGESRMLPLLPYRDEAMAFVRSRGIRWIVAPTGSGGQGPLGKSLVTYPNAWGVDPVEEVDGAWLFRLR